MSYFQFRKVQFRVAVGNCLEGNFELSIPQGPIQSSRLRSRPYGPHQLSIPQGPIQRRVVAPGYVSGMTFNSARSNSEVAVGNCLEGNFELSIPQGPIQSLEGADLEGAYLRFQFRKVQFRARGEGAVVFILDTFNSARSNSEGRAGRGLGRGLSLSIPQGPIQSPAQAHQRLENAAFQFRKVQFRGQLRPRGRPLLSTFNSARSNSEVGG